MPGLDAAALLRRPLPTVRQGHAARDAVLYALGVGACVGADDLDWDHLPYVHGEPPRVVPTFCTVLGDPGFWMSAPDTGLDWRLLVHGEESVRWLAPIPAEGEVIAQHRVCRVEDRGAQRGSAFVVERLLRDAAGGQTLAVMRTTVVARGNGGWTPAGMPLMALGEPAEPAPPPLPQRAPDRVLLVPTDRRAPLLHRLNADPNPLHVDPVAARAAGFERPIMHGMCTFGTLALHLVQAWCGGEPVRLEALRARFTAPLYPGQRLRCEFWQQPEGLRFRVGVDGAGTVVLQDGWARLREPDTSAAGRAGPADPPA